MKRWWRNLRAGRRQKEDLRAAKELIESYVPGRARAHLPLLDAAKVFFESEYFRGGLDAQRVFLRYEVVSVEGVDPLHWNGVAVQSFIRETGEVLGEKIVYAIEVRTGDVYHAAALLLEKRDPSHVPWLVGNVYGTRESRVSGQRAPETSE